MNTKSMNFNIHAQETFVFPKEDNAASNFLQAHALYMGGFQE